MTNRPRPRLLDLYCGAGGAAMGYSRMGFDILGVDINPQPHYPFPFVQADALDILGEFQTAERLQFVGTINAIHASPPCQKFTRFQQSQPKRVNNHPDLIGPTRELLKLTGLPWVIENVPGAPLINPVLLCGTEFELGVARGQLWRHRLFEASFPITGTPCRHDGRPAVMVAGHGKDGYRGSGLNAAEAREAMDIHWMNRDEMAEAVPPAYTEDIGRQLLWEVKRVAA